MSHRLNESMTPHRFLSRNTNYTRDTDLYSPDMAATYNAMEDELTCPVCLELFADPLMLPCSHSICKRCIQDILESRRKSVADGFDCPSCRKCFTLSPDQLLSLPRNLSLENIVFRYQEIQSNTLTKSRSLDMTKMRENRTHSIKSDSEIPVFEDFDPLLDVICDLCDTNNCTKAKFTCDECRVSYCYKCLEKYHPKIGIFMRHTISIPKHPKNDDNTTIADMNNPQTEMQFHKCTDHLNVDVAIFCLTCNISVCHLCVCQDVGKHVSHKIVDQKTAHKEIKENVAKAKVEIESLTEKVVVQRKAVEKHRLKFEGIRHNFTSYINNQSKSFITDICDAIGCFQNATSDYMNSKTDDIINKLNVLDEENKHDVQKMAEFTDACKQVECATIGDLLKTVGDGNFVGDKKLMADLRERIKKAENQMQAELTGGARAEKDIKECAVTFNQGIMDLLHDVLSPAHVICPRVTPLFQTANSPGKSDAVNVQNKVLTTWGFKSSTFSANFLYTSARWSVTIERNTSHVGELKNGYLFGIGVSTDALSLKDNVGLNKQSYGVICDAGMISYSHNGVKVELCPLDKLPVNVNFAVEFTRSHVGDDYFAVLKYGICDGDWVEIVQGRRVLDTNIVRAYRPVFAVNQRVRMLLCDK